MGRPKKEVTAEKKPRKAKKVVTDKSQVKSRGVRKLSDAQVLDIVARWRNGAKQSHLAKEYGVANPSIAAIVHGRTYVWLTGIGVEEIRQAA